MKKIISSLLLLSLTSNLLSEDVYYPAIEDQSGYEAPYGSIYAPYAGDEASCQSARHECPGNAYYNCRNAACLTAGIIIGTAVIVGLVALVINQSSCAHNH